MDLDKDTLETPAMSTPGAPPVSEAQNAADAVNEIRELAEAESEQWDYMPKPPRKLRKSRDHLFLKIFIPMLIVFVILFGTVGRLVFGKGWLKNMLDGAKHTSLCP